MIIGVTNSNDGDVSGNHGLGISGWSVFRQNPSLFRISLETTRAMESGHWTTMAMEHGMELTSIEFTCWISNRPACRG
jgi:hypothetical protein